MTLAEAIRIVINKRADVLKALAEYDREENKMRPLQKDHKK